MTNPTLPHASKDDVIIHGMPVQERIEWLIHHSDHHSQEFKSPKSWLARSRYHAKHPTAIVAFKCMDEHITIQVATNTPHGIILQFRNPGSRFHLGWPHLVEVLADHVPGVAGRGRLTLALITYHCSKGNCRRGYAVFNYGTDAAHSLTFGIQRQVEALFSTGHGTAYPVVCCFETDEAAPVLHGSDGEVLDLSSTVSSTNRDNLPSLPARLYPDMPDQMRQDLLHLVRGNITRIAGIRQANRELNIEHREWMICIGRGFDWLHMPNLAHIMGPYSPDLADPIRKAAGIIEANMHAGRIPDDGFLLLIVAPNHEIGSDRARAGLKSGFLSGFAADVIRTEITKPAEKMQVRTAIIAWQSRAMVMIDPCVARTAGQ
ncbi:MAG: hypothetical protein KGS09_01575 [Nitrospirae bacterium]|nr:hypothetical protein [Nitrospirota bacterium]